MRASSSATATVLALILWPIRATAAPAPGEVPDSEAPPIDGYNVLLGVKAKERAVEESGEYAPSVRTTGVLAGRGRVAVILVEVEDGVPGPLPERTAYEARWFAADAPGAPAMSVEGYYADVSGGSFHVEGQVTDWIRPGVSLDALTTVDGIHKVLSAADDQIDFSKFDDDNLDGTTGSWADNRVVDAVIIVPNVRDDRCLDPGHSVRGSTRRLSIQTEDDRYQTKDIGVELGLDFQPLPILVDHYSIVPGLLCANSDGKPRPANIGVAVHEYGHQLGLPDLYDRDNSSSGVGVWCSMSWGCYGGDGQTHFDRPVELSAWPRVFLGWAKPERIYVGETFELPASDARDHVYLLKPPGAKKTEYFLIEWRDPNWIPDALRVNWDADLPGTGMAVWHVDESVGRNTTDPRGWPWASKGHQNDTPWTSANPSRHYLVALKQADGRMDLEKGKNFGDAGDLFGLGSKLADNLNVPSGSRSYPNARSGIVISVPVSGDLARVDSEAGDSPPSAPSPVALNSGEPATGEGGLDATPEGDAAPGGVAAPTGDAAPGEDPAPAGDSGPTPPLETVEHVPASEFYSSDGPGLSKCLRRLAEQSEVETKDIVVQAVGAQVVGVLGLETKPVANPVDDAKKRIDHCVGKLFAIDETLELVAPDDRSARPVRFQQVRTVEGVALPVFGAGVVLYYDDAQLRAVQSTVVPIARLVLADAPVSDAASASGALMRIFGLPAAPEARRGIYLPPDAPGRVAWEAIVRDEQGAEFRVYLDDQTLKVLAIEGS